MARPLRIKYPGAWYHVIHRASSRAFIFNMPGDFILFLDRLEEAYRQYKIEIHAYCLMSNHYHLLVRTPYSNLSEAMRHINGIFTQKYNRLHGSDGALFRGRYKAILVEAEGYLLQLSRYIHLNPIVAGIARMPEEYPWSSYNYFINEMMQKPNWLFCDIILSHFNEDNKQRKYRKFVLDGINDETESIYKKKNMMSVLGSDEFISEINKKYASYVSHEEIPECLAIKKYNYPTVEELIILVSNYFDIDSLDITRKPNRKKGNVPRKIALYLAFRLSINNKRDICKIFDGISYRSVSQICRRVEVELIKEGSQIFNDIKEIKKLIISNCGNGCV